jgi:hypothetical protein
MGTADPIGEFFPVLEQTGLPDGGRQHLIVPGTPGAGACEAVGGACEAVAPGAGACDAVGGCFSIYI